MSQPAAATTRNSTENGATAVEDLLEIRRGAGDNYVDLWVDPNKLVTPSVGPLTSGQKLQFRLLEATPIGNSPFRRIPDGF